MAFEDKTLTCADCGADFTFSADDQAYHQERGFTNEPRRCPPAEQAGELSVTGAAATAAVVVERI